MGVRGHRFQCGGWFKAYGCGLMVYGLWFVAYGLHDGCLGYRASALGFTQNQVLRFSVLGLGITALVDLPQPFHQLSDAQRTSTSKPRPQPGLGCLTCAIHRYLANKKHPAPRTLQ